MVANDVNSHELGRSAKEGAMHCKCWTTEGVAKAGRAGDAMRSSPDYIEEQDSLLVAAGKLTDLDAGILPVCGPGERLRGLLTPHDLVVKVAMGKADPARVTAGEVVEGAVVAVGKDESLGAALHTMRSHRIKRLPVLEEQRLVGILDLADVLEGYPRHP
jgi:CBS domain-containing protein